MIKNISYLNFYPIPILLGILISVMVFSTLSLANNKPEVMTEPVEEKENATMTLVSDTIPVLVSGVIEAVNQTTVYAETSGVIIDLPIREGETVNKDTVVSMQATPVADAQLALTQVEAGLNNIKQNQASLLLVGDKQKTLVNNYSAVELAFLREVDNVNRLSEVAQNLQTTVRQNVLTMTKLIDYVNNNRSLFNAEGLRLYDKIVINLYGQLPNHFRGKIISGGYDRDFAAIYDYLENATLTVPEIKTLSLITATQLQTLNELFMTGEGDVFSRDSNVLETEKQNYLTMRQLLIESLQNLEVASAKLDQISDTILADGLTNETNVAITEIDKELAEVQIFYASEIKQQITKIGELSVNLVNQTKKLGEIRSLFSGYVSKVHVKVGQYVTAGTPILNLIGDGREIKATVPTSLALNLKTGQPFIGKNGEVIGYINRFSVNSEYGSVLVVIDLHDNTLVTGSSLFGYVQIEAPENVFKIPRSFLHFNNQGAYLLYKNSDISPVKIVYDTGADLFVLPDNILDIPIVSKLNISL